MRTDRPRVVPAARDGGPRAAVVRGREPLEERMGLAAGSSLGRGYGRVYLIGGPTAGRPDAGGRLGTPAHATHSASSRAPRRKTGRENPSKNPGM